MKNQTKKNSRTTDTKAKDFTADEWISTDGWRVDVRKKYMGMELQTVRHLLVKWPENNVWVQRLDKHVIIVKIPKINFTNSLIFIHTKQKQKEIYYGRIVTSVQSFCMCIPQQNLKIQFFFRFFVFTKENNEHISSQSSAQIWLNIWPPETNPRKTFHRHKKHTPTHVNNKSKQNKNTNSQSHGDISFGWGLTTTFEFHSNLKPTLGQMI